MSVVEDTNGVYLTRDFSVSLGTSKNFPSWFRGAVS